MKPTPRPWRFDEAAITDETGLKIHRWFMAGDKPLPLTKENADLIVSSVNQSDHIKILVSSAESVSKKFRDLFYGELNYSKLANEALTEIIGLEIALKNYRRATEGKQ